MSKPSDTTVSGTELDTIAAQISNPDLTEVDVKALQARIYDLTAPLALLLSQRERALQAAKLAAIPHPAWCAEKGKDDQGDHFGESTIIPCTGGGFQILEDAAAFPWLDVFVSQAAGRDHAGVALEAYQPGASRDCGVQLPALVARTFAEQLWTQVTRAESAADDLSRNHTEWCCEQGEDPGHGGDGCLSYPEALYIDEETDHRVFACAHLRADDRTTVQVTVAFTDSDFVEVDLTTYEAGMLSAALSDSVQLIERS